MNFSFVYLAKILPASIWVKKKNKQKHKNIENSWMYKAKVIRLPLILVSLEVIFLPWQRSCSFRFHERSALNDENQQWDFVLN